MFQRTDDYMTKITLDALDREVILNADIHIKWDKGKWRCWCDQTQTWVQFPNDLRTKHKRFVADVVKAQRGSNQVFYRAYHGSIRSNDSGKEGPVIG